MVDFSTWQEDAEKPWRLVAESKQSDNIVLLDDDQLLWDSAVNI